MKKKIPNISIHQLFYKIEKKKKNLSQNVGLFVFHPMYRICCFFTSYFGTFMANNADLPSTATFMTPFEWKSNIDFMVGNQKRTHSTRAPHTMPSSFSDTFQWFIYEVMPMLTSVVIQLLVPNPHTQQIWRMYVCVDSKQESYIYVNMNKSCCCRLVTLHDFAMYAFGKMVIENISKEKNRTKHRNRNA